MRSANVLVTIHGSGSNNALFMEEGSTLIEIRPYQFGTRASEWANAFMPKVVPSTLKMARAAGAGRLRADPRGLMPCMCLSLVLHATLE